MLLRLFIKDWRVFLRDRVSVALTFLVPVVLIFIFGQVFGGTAGGRTQPIVLPLLNESGDPFATAVDAALESSPNFRVLRGTRAEDGSLIPFTRETLRAHVERGRARLALHIPPAKDENSFGFHARLYVDPRNPIETSIAEGLLQETVFRQLPSAFQVSARDFLGQPGMDAFSSDMVDAVARHFGVDAEEVRKTLGDFLAPPSTEDEKAAGPGDGMTVDTSDFFSQLVELDKVQVTGAEVRSPGATRQVGGWALMFLLFAVTGFATSLFEEKHSGITQRILSGPATRNQLLGGKFLFSVSLGIVQLTSLFLAGWMLFGVDVFANLPSLVLAIVCAASACTGFGMLLASFCRTAAQVQGLGTFVILTMSAVGGAWFPVSMMPDTVQFFSRLTIVFWAQEAFYGALWQRLSLAEMLPTAGILLGTAAVVSVIALVRFRRSQLL